MTYFDDVVNFHIKFGLYKPLSSLGTTLPSEQLYFRHRFHLEEFSEFQTALAKQDLVGATDALIDLTYVLLGTMVFMQYDWKLVTSLFKLIPSGPPGFCHQTLTRVYQVRLKHQLDMYYTIHHIVSEESSNPLFAVAHLVEALGEVHNLVHAMHLPWDEVWNIVHSKNMQKVRAKADGSDSKRQSSQDVIKPPDWTPPESLIRKCLIDHGANL